MSVNYQKPTNKNEPFSFSIDVAGETHVGTIAPIGKQPAFGMPNAFVVRMPGKPPANISIYMGKWVMHANADFVGALGKWIEDKYK